MEEYDRNDSDRDFYRSGDGDRKIKVTYTLYLPDHSHHKELMDRSADMYSVLDEIYQRCRTVWKHEDNPSEDRVQLAEEIAQMVNEITRTFNDC
jgi:hypothetical protein